MSKLTTKKNPPFCEKEVRILPEHFEEGIQFVLDNNCDGIFLDYRPESKNEGLIMDFTLFRRIPHLRSLLISPFLELNAKQPLEGLEALNQLTTLRWQQKNQFAIDFSWWPKLEYLFYKYSKKAVHLHALTALKELQVNSLNTDDCTPLRGLSGLTKLFIVQSKLASLNGLQELTNLHELELESVKNLQDISAVTSLRRLQILIFIKTEVADLSALRQAKSVQRLSIEKTASLDFVRDMPQLEFIGFGEVADGNLHPLLEVPALQSVMAHPQKKHYTHTEDEVNTLLKTRVE